MNSFYNKASRWNEISDSDVSEFKDYFCSIVKSFDREYISIMCLKGFDYPNFIDIYVIDTRRSTNTKKFKMDRDGLVTDSL